MTPASPERLRERRRNREFEKTQQIIKKMQLNQNQQLAQQYWAQSGGYGINSAQVSPFNIDPFTGTGI